jgi:outer membrane protein assembly factor BamB
VPSPVTGGDWRQFGYDAQRSGAGPADTGITAANLGRLRRRTVALPGTVDSAAVELHAVRVGARVRDVAMLTTTYGLTVAVDPGTGRRLWTYTPGGVRAVAGTYQVTNTTPIVDPDRRYVYTASPNGFVHKLRVSDGRAVWSRAVTLLPSREKLAGALNITGGSVIAVTDGYIGDAPPYQGHVVLLNRSNGRITRVFNTLCSNRRHLQVPSTCPASDSAVWGRAGSVVEPGTGRILVATGNGPFNGSTDWGDSVLELSPALALLHNWTPRDQAALNAGDTDLGSTEPALLGRVGGRRLAVQGGKDGILRLLDLDRLNGTRGGAGPRTGGELQDIGDPGHAQLFSAPAVWREHGRLHVFVADGAGTAGYLLGRGGRLDLAWSRGTPGTSPVVAGGLLYVYDELGGSLVIRDPVSGRALRTLPAASGHWNSPIVIGGRIILPEGTYMSHSTSGTLDIYHLPGR